MRKTTTYSLAAMLISGVICVNMPDSAAAPPQPVTPPLSQGGTPQTAIHWTAKRVGESVSVTTDLGSLTTRDGELQVLDSQGTIVAGLPLAYQFDGKQFPIAAEVNGNTATLTPNTTPAAGTPLAMPAALPPGLLEHVDAQSDFDNNVSRAANQFGLATGAGALIGTIVGGAGGCVAGAVVGAALMTPIFVPGWVGSCIAGAAAGVALGAAAGTVLLGVPVGIASAIQFFQLQTTPKPGPEQNSAAAAGN
ncbi:hypothetical protein [Nocardia africana]|uniref:DUF8020 domain-containing protein n=2 Tax=Nocardia africana TaxID=134964 RepID=A0A378WUB2_9NOCA|nr:hypothetical protein [Nocardia africana]SUA44808.1 Uncharacterised protein [Nocardia africana]